MKLFRKNIISANTVKIKSDKLMKQALRDAKKKLKNGEIIDSHSFALYLPTIDARYNFLKSEVNVSTLVYNYSEIRASKIAETRRLLAFFDQDCAELDRLSQIVAKKAEDAGKIDDFKHEKLSAIDLSKLKANFDSIDGKEI